MTTTKLYTVTITMPNFDIGYLEFLSSLSPIGTLALCYFFDNSSWLFDYLYHHVSDLNSGLAGGDVATSHPFKPCYFNPYCSNFNPYYYYLIKIVRPLALLPTGIILYYLPSSLFSFINSIFEIFNKFLAKSLAILKKYAIIIFTNYYGVLTDADAGGSHSDANNRVASVTLNNGKRKYTAGSGFYSDQGSGTGNGGDDGDDGDDRRKKWGTGWYNTLKEREPLRAFHLLVTLVNLLLNIIEIAGIQQIQIRDGSSDRVRLDSILWHIQLELTQDFINSYHPDLDFNFQLFMFNVNGYTNGGVVRIVTDENRDTIVSELESIIYGANILLQSLLPIYEGRVPSSYNDNNDNNNDNGQQ